MIEYIKNKKIIILLLITIFFGIKTNFFKNISELVQYDYNERLINNYGFCSNESIGYLKYLKKKYNITDNPQIINYAQAPNVTWSIINTQNINNNCDSNLDTSLEESAPVLSGAACPDLVFLVFCRLPWNK